MVPTDEEANLRERVRLRAAALKEQGLLTQADLEGAELLPVPGNANSFVPWDDPNIPYECSCGQIIWADTPHSHGEELVYLEAERHHDKGKQMRLHSQLSLDEVAGRAIELFNKHEVKHYLEDHGDEFRGAGRAYEAGDAVRAAMEQLSYDDKLGQSEYDEVAPSWWPEAEERVRAAIPDYNEEIERRQALGYQT